MINWNFDRKGFHQTTIRIDKTTALLLESSFDNLSNQTLQQLVIDALKSYATVEQRLNVMELRLTRLERVATSQS